jgi:hypothetical protein
MIASRYTYQDHLLRVRGLEPKTCEGLLTSGRRILVWLRDNLPDVSGGENPRINGAFVTDQGC